MQDVSRVVDSDSFVSLYSSRCGYASKSPIADHESRMSPVSGTVRKILAHIEDNVVDELQFGIQS